MARTIVLAAVCALTIAACAPQHGDFAAPTSSRSPYVESAQSTRPPVDAPQSEHDAFDAATATVAAAEGRAFAVANYDADYESLGEFGDWRGGMSWEGVLDRNVDDDVVGGPDVWVFDYSLSSASALTTSGESDEFADVRLVGCILVNWVVAYNDPEMQTWVLGSALPRAVAVQYDAARHNWFVTGSDDLAGRPGGPDCN